MNNVGIIGYGAYIPKYRITTQEIASVWGKNGEDIQKSLGVSQKSVPNIDEDSVTLSYESAISALTRAQIAPHLLEACFIGSESHPYAVNPTSTIVAEFLGLGNNYIAVDLEFACKAATAGMQAIAGLIASGKISYGLTIGVDTAQSRPHDALEYTAASGGAAFVLGGDKKEILANILDFSSFSSDTPDFWRREGIRYPSHGGRFTGEPAYFTHVLGAAKRLLEKTHLQPTDFSYCVFHMPNGKFPREVAKRLGFTPDQLAPSLIVDHIGNPYSASSLLGLASVLDIAQPKQKIFLVSYGSGAGADSFIFQTTPILIKKRRLAPLFASFLKDTQTISYSQYLRFEQKL
ncbi:hydroxymethylglutaryl-CoA synthase [Candidatus Gottesmanbacteria bacterium]|nr:hydroxymethylglutaryl-CoA synthase [Candidatus Gottesmanbacteria bacterium]